MSRPTGFAAKCRCGVYVGALDAARTDRADMGKILGEWLFKGMTVEPRFTGTWSVELQSCRCSSQETLADRQREPDAIEKQALYGNLRELYRRDRVVPETGVRCTCKDYPGADQFCTAHKVRPAHTAAHDCACAECVKAETQTEDDGARRERLGLCLAETADGRDMKRCAAFPECLCGGPSGNR